MTLNPLEEYVISRQLNDPADVGTNYVQAVIRNAKTDAIIATVNLTDKGSQRFTKTWQVVGDPTGLGLYITITTTVYTDSGYSVKSTTYGIEQHEHLVQDRINPYLRGGGADVDYKRIKKMIDEAVGSIPKPEKPPKVDLYPIQSALLDLHDAVKAIRIPESEKVDLEPVLSQLSSLQQLVKAIEIPETDLSSVLEKIDQQEEKIKPNVEAISSQLEEIVERVKQYIGSDMETIKGGMARLNEKLDQMPYVVIDPKKESPKPKRDILTEYLND